MVHHEVDVREKLRLRDLLLDVHPCGQFTEGAGLNTRAGGHKHLTPGAGDLERRGLQQVRLAEHRPHGQVDPRSPPWPKSHGGVAPSGDQAIGRIAIDGNAGVAASFGEEGRVWGR